MPPFSSTPTPTPNRKPPPSPRAALHQVIDDIASRAELDLPRIRDYLMQLWITHPHAEAGDTLEAREMSGLQRLLYLGLTDDRPRHLARLLDYATDPKALNRYGRIAGTCSITGRANTRQIDAWRAHITLTSRLVRLETQGICPFIHCVDVRH